MKYKKIKVTANADQSFKSFEIEVREPNLQDRAKLNEIMDQDQKQNFSFWLKIIRTNTRYTDDELNQYSLEELVGMSSAIIESANKKKLKK